MQSLKKFYKIYSIVISLLCVIASIIGGAGGSIGLGIKVFIFFMSLPILIYGAFVYFPSRFYARFSQYSTQSQQDKQESEDTSTFRILYVVVLVGFILAILVK